VSDPRLVSLAEHPDAGPAIRRLKARAGLAAFAAVMAVGFMHGLPLVHALERALVGGIAAYVLTWWAALTIWTRLLRARARATVEASRRP
jgi:hypothetical protein